MPEEKKTETRSKGIRERILDCITSHHEDANTQKMLDTEDQDNQNNADYSLREALRSELSIVWNQYRHKKWLNSPELPPLEDIEARLINLVPSYSALYRLDLFV